MPRRAKAVWIGVTIILVILSILLSSRLSIPGILEPRREESSGLGGYGPPKEVGSPDQGGTTQVDQQPQDYGSVGTSILLAGLVIGLSLALAVLAALNPKLFSRLWGRQQ